MASIPALPKDLKIGSRNFSPDLIFEFSLNQTDSHDIHNHTTITQKTWNFNSNSVRNNVTNDHFSGYVSKCAS